ncbi:winged helix-turn-helix transcriptional regulator, MarR family [Syntrophotalea carbinolica DSM 2380]|uniref:Winged helix-turn-helix transcriptional regulator, MarR family n=1 Tax=Syntrophotalea carbinolica (strain DSM 2380 / NBRC 103641 / GraBd1) TaxID=338963 RepID=Q3A0F9_SYNC1|nr:MarR family transcriptional regulator [Syntrophotalea carbinolica]ABA90148.1 winged helix-turn-helix transcriptional regulator, MarR family [Syntrophotalea carbinolica DSM 2380]
MTSQNYSILEDSLGYLISFVGQRYKNEAWRRLRSFGITLEQWLVLNCLAVDEGICQRALAQRIDKEQPNTTRILDNMERKELIRRTPDPADRRAFLVFLTEKGKGFLEELVPVSRQLRDESIRGFSESEIKTVKELLRKFLANLD